MTISSRYWRCSYIRYCWGMLIRLWSPAHVQHLVFPLALRLRSIDSASLAQICSPTSPLLRKGLTSPVRASLATAPRLPNADHMPKRSWAKLEISRFPNEMCINMPGSLTTPSRGSTRYNALQRVAFRRIRIRRHSGLGFFRGSMAGLSTPLSTLHDTPHDAARMTRGQHR